MIYIQEFFFNIIFIILYVYADFKSDIICK